MAPIMTQTTDGVTATPISIPLAIARLMSHCVMQIRTSAAMLGDSRVKLSDSKRRPY
jgi:hypothetical protein